MTALSLQEKGREKEASGAENNHANRTPKYDWSKTLSTAASWIIAAAVVINLWVSLSRGSEERIMNEIHKSETRITQKMEGLERSTNERIERLENRIDKRFDRIDTRFERLENRINESNQRISKIEGRLER